VTKDLSQIEILATRKDLEAGRFGRRFVKRPVNASPQYIDRGVSVRLILRQNDDVGVLFGRDSADQLMSILAMDIPKQAC
jgi:hypothetical protein